jgi:Mor family transcriptional regulator
MPKVKRPAPVFTEPDLVDRLFEYVLELLPEAAKREIAGQSGELKQMTRDRFGGIDKAYVRTGHEYRRVQMVDQVLSMFNGRNATEVARRLQISRATVYRILKQPGPQPRETVSSSPKT